MGTAQQRPLYLAARGILTAPVFLSSIVVGAMMEALAPEAVFAAALGLSAVGLGLAWGLPRATMRQAQEGSAASPL